MKQILASLIVVYALTNGQTTTSAPGSTAATTATTASTATTATTATAVLGNAATTASTAATSQAPATTASRLATSVATTTAYTAPPPPIDLISLLNPVTTSSSANPPPPPINPGLGLGQGQNQGPPANNPGQGQGPPVVVPPVSATPAPVTPAPTTPAPTTSAPTTAAPTYNPYCPMPAALSSQHGVQSGQPMSSNAGCLSPWEVATAFNGILQCSSFACCQCAEIKCGDPMGLPCDELVISDSGAVGNQNINVLGDMTSAFGGNSFAGIGGAMNNGAQINCNGLEACKAARIYGKYVGQLSCSGDMGCSGANIRLEDPGNELQVQCNGMMSCMNTNLEIIITPNSQIVELGTIEFNGQQSAQGMTITLTNAGNLPIMLQTLECMNPTACPNLRIQINGNVFIENCDLQHMQIQAASPSLLAACQAGQAFQGGGNFLPGVGIPPFMPPQAPPRPPINQVPPTNPGNFNPPAQQPPANNPPVTVTPPVQQPPAQQPPATVTPPVQQPPVTQPGVPGFGQQPGVPGLGTMPFMVDPSQLNCEFMQCRNRRLTLSPGHNFQLQCQQPMICDGLDLTLNVGPDYFNNQGFGNQIDTLTFSAPTNGATIRINSVQGTYVEVGDIRCEVFGACNNLKIITGPGVELWNLNMDCQQYGACNGCTVNGIDCNTLSWQTNQFGGNFYPGMGYPTYPQQQQPQNQYPPQQQIPYPQYPQIPYQWI